MGGYATERNIAEKWRIVQLTIPTTMTKLSEVIASASPSVPAGFKINEIEFLEDGTQDFKVYDLHNSSQGVSIASGETRSFPLNNAGNQSRVKADTTQGTVTAVLWS